MHDKCVAAGGNDGARQPIERHFRILVVDADPAFHRHRNFHRALHRRDAGCNEVGLRHQAGAEAAVLHPIRRTADIEVDLVIAETLADPRGFSELARIGAAELQRDGMLAGIEAEQPRAVAMDDGGRGQHLRVEPRAPRQQAMEHAAMPVGPVHHRGDGEAMGRGACVRFSHLGNLLDRSCGSTNAALVSRCNRPYTRP